MVLTAFCLLLPEMNLSLSLRPAAGRLTRISVPSMMPVFPLDADMVDDLGEGPQPHSGADGAASLGEQGSHLADSPGDGGAINSEPAGQHVICVAA
ncbi:hypothetical protein [Streptomyces sp. NPDC004250]|uniref:hypothetical protein n=1 Tax=Streptomyces sp. NPDC004250 TaxID=3364692 RepID=UPI0036973489